MKHASAIVFYRKSTKQLYRIRVSTKYDNRFSFDLLNYELTSDLPYKYDDFDKMYNSVLNILKNNNLIPYSYPAFGTILYDVSWFDIDTLQIERFGLLGE